MPKNLAAKWRTLSTTPLVHSRDHSFLIRSFLPQHKKRRRRRNLSIRKKPPVRRTLVERFCCCRLGLTLNIVTFVYQKETNTFGEKLSPKPTKQRRRTDECASLQKAEKTSESVKNNLLDCFFNIRIPYCEGSIPGP